MSWTRVSNGSDRPHDLAIATIAAALPTGIFRFPRVSTEEVGAAVNDRDILSPAYIVGFGGTVPGGNAPNDGNRRWALTVTPSIVKHSCDVFSWAFNGFNCNDDWEWEVARTEDGGVDEPEHGDSGSPLYLQDRSGNKVIVGVDSGDVSNFIGDSVSIWAPTGENGQFILNQLGGDADNDGVFDSFDNCPPLRCVQRGQDATQCANPDQNDADGDGVGDECDNCPQALCDGYPQLEIGISCFNPNQADHDDDGRGDTCDLCPHSSETFFGPTELQQDDDDDGVGNACDGCPSFSPFPSCTSDSQCPGEAGFGSFCVVATSHCADLPDSDGDFVPDACDNCPSFQSPDTRNSNSLAEFRERLNTPSIATLGDACDPVPLVRIGPEMGSLVTMGDILGDGRGPADIATIFSDRWSGVDTSTPLGSITSQRRITYRQCTCVDPKNGTLQTLDLCVGPGKTCDWASPDASSAWKVITVQGANGNSVLGTNGWSSPFPFTTNTSFLANVIWQWRQDVLAGRVTGLGSCPGVGPSDCQTHGAIFTRVDRGTPALSARDSGFNLRDDFAMYDTPDATFVAGLANNFPVGGLSGCPSCVVRWLMPDLGDPFPLQVLGDLPEPTPVLFTGTAVSAFTPDTAFDASPFFDSNATATLSSPVLWLGAVESRRLLRERLGIALVETTPSVVLSTTLALGDTPTYVVPSSPKMTVFNPGQAAELELGSAEAAAQLLGGPSLQSGVSGAYSALEGAVYVVGGQNQSGGPAQAVWRWSVSANHWQAILSSAALPPASRVLGTAYDALRQRLYVLDVADDSLPTQRFARLVRYDILTGTSTETLLLPFVGQHRLVSLSALEDGTLALVAADSAAYTAWRVDASGTAALFTGLTVASGTVVAPPVMGEDHLYLPVVRASKLVVDELSSKTFQPGAACTGL